MKRFRFRYQTLLEVRERAQKQEEEILQHLLRRQGDAEQALNKLKADEQAQRDSWMALQAGGALPLDEIAMIQGFLQILEKRIRSARQAYEDATARCDNQRALLTDAMRQVEIIRKLKERDEKAWRDALERSEAAELDELATLRYAFVRQQR